MLACLGLFVFALQTAPLTQRSRSTTWRHARNAAIGKRAGHQFIGPGDDVVTLTGIMAHDIGGKALSLDVLRAMADSGEAYVLVQGNGQVIGSFIIEDINEVSRELFANGTPRMIEFSITLGRVDDDLIDKLALITSPLSLLS